MNVASLRPFLPRPALRRRQLPIQHRKYAIQTPGSPILQVFNDKTKHLQRERSASNVEGSRKVDYLRDEVASRLCERLLDIRRHFSKVLDVGANACNIAHALSEPPDSTAPPLLTRLSHLTSADTSSILLHRDADQPFNNLLPSHHRTILQTPDSPLPFKTQSFNAVLSSLSLHWVNDLPSLFSQINNVLEPDSPFLGAMLGGDSLYELRGSLQLADLDRRGGVSNHVSPFANTSDMSGLLQKAGFKLVTVDVDEIVIDFPSTFDLMIDLQAMGESNATLTREMSGLRRDVLLANEAIYRGLYGNEDGSLPATFKVIFMIGWTPGKGQPEPLPRGSGQINMKDVLEGAGGGA